MTDADKNARRAAALRENLRKRKAQARATENSEASVPDASQEAEQGDAGIISSGGGAPH